MARMAGALVLNIVHGLEKAPEGLIGLLRGRNFGKLLVKVAAE